MNFGTAVLVIIGVWALVSVAVSVTIGGVAGYRDSERFSLRRFGGTVRDTNDDSADRIAS